MKKYSLGIFALILAIELCSFTISQKTTVVPSLYWYDADDGYPYFGELQTAEIPPGCGDGNEPCAYGFTTTQSDPLSNVSQASYIATED